MADDGKRIRYRDSVTQQEINLNPLELSDGTYALPSYAADVLSTTGLDSDKITNVDEVSGSVTYVGTAVVGTLESAAAWAIQKLEVTGTVTTIKWADGVTTETKVWDDRATFTYS